MKASSRASHVCSRPDDTSGHVSHALDTRLSFKDEKGSVRMELEVDTSSFGNRRDSLIDHASTRVDSTAQRHGDNHNETAVLPTGRGSRTVLGQAVYSLGHIAASVDNLAEVGARTACNSTGQD